MHCFSTVLYIEAMQNSKCVCSSIAAGECEDMEGRKPRKTYKDLERPVTTLGGVHPLLCSGVNRFHVCLHFIYCSTCCCRHSGYKAFLDYYCVIVRVAGGGTQRLQHLTDLNRCMLLTLLQECHPPEDGNIGS